MSDLAQEFQASLVTQNKAALLTILSPSTTVVELTDLVRDNSDLTTITLGEIAVSNQTPSKSSPPNTDKPARKSKKMKKRNVRTAEGRKALDAEVYTALARLGGDRVAAVYICRMIGADGAQVRTSLNRMIGENVVSYTGQARGTRYSISG